MLEAVNAIHFSKEAILPYGCVRFAFFWCVVRSFWSLGRGICCWTRNFVAEVVD